MGELKVNHSHHSLYRLEYHLILVTKYRKRCITQEVYDFLHKETLRLMEGWNVELIEMNFEPNHVHILISTTPQICLGTMINSYKSVTSRLVRKQFPEHMAKYYWKPYFWSRSYMILSSGGASIETIRKYIQNQAGDDATIST